MEFNPLTGAPLTQLEALKKERDLFDKLLDENPQNFGADILERVRLYEEYDKKIQEIIGCLREQRKAELWEPFLKKAKGIIINTSSKESALIRDKIDKLCNLVQRGFPPPHPEDYLKCLC